MPSSYLGSPPDRRSKTTRDHRVSFSGGTKFPPDGPFDHPPSGSSSSSAFAVPGPLKQKHHHHHHAHASTSRAAGAQKASRRARVDDVDDDDSEDDDPDDKATKHATDRGKGKEKALDQGPAPVGYPPPPGPPGAFAALFNPALGPNPIYTHQHHPQHQLQQQPYNIQAFPTFVPHGAASGQPLSMATMDPYSGATGISFVPAVPDATNGPMLHTYVPRNDPPALGGAVYMQQMHQMQQYPGGFPNQAVPYTNVPVATSMPVATSTAPMMPIVTQPQAVYIQQPSMAYGGGGGCGPPPVMMMSGGLGTPGSGGGGFPASYPGGYPGMIHPEPALGVGQTPAEVMQEQLEFAYANNMYEPQDFKPADDDVSRFYWVREQDGNWTQRSRATIDHIGCRWYITDTGIFYAVRLPD